MACWLVRAAALVAMLDVGKVEVVEETSSLEAAVWPQCRCGSGDAECIGTQFWQTRVYCLVLSGCYVYSLLLGHGTSLHTSR